MTTRASVERFLGRFIHGYSDVRSAALTAEPTHPVMELLEVKHIKEAECLSSADKKHLERAAEIVKAGGIVAFPFNGVFGLFGDIDRLEAEQLILEAKNRPHDRKLIQVCLPEYARELADFSRTNFREDKVIKLWRDIHALGIILPAATTAPYHTVIRENGSATVLPIWTEYSPLRHMVEHFRKLGGRALVGTSANRIGEPTHWKYDDLKKDFCFSVQALVEADFSYLPEIRRRSTSILDLTEEKPRWHREGNVTEAEIREALARHNFPQLQIGRDVIQVRARG